MKKFQVTARFTTYCTVEILAEDENDAYLKAKEMDGGDFEPWEHGGWEIDNVEEVEPVFTRDQLAFMDAYATACAAENRETVEAFFMIDDGDDFCDRHGTGAYSSIMDAYQMWQLAISHQRAIEKNN